MKTFREKHPFESRLQESTRIMQKYPARVPIICSRHRGNTNIPLIDKQKYLVPSDLTIGQFIFVIRKRIHLDPEVGLFLFVNNVLPPTASLISTIYNDHKDDDGFLYITYSGENTFG